MRRIAALLISALLPTSGWAQTRVGVVAPIGADVTSAPAPQLSAPSIQAFSENSSVLSIPSQALFVPAPLAPSPINAEILPAIKKTATAQAGLRVLARGLQSKDAGVSDRVFDAVVSRSIPSRITVWPETFDAGGVNRRVAAYGYREAHPESPPGAADAFAAAYPGILKKHFFAVLQKHPHRVENRVGFTVYNVADGLAFWTDLLTSADPDERLAARVLRENQGISGDDRVLKLLNDLYWPRFATRFFDIRRMGPDGFRNVAALAEDLGLSSLRFGDWALVGGGATFPLTARLLRQAEALANPALKRIFARVVRFLAGQDVDIATGESQTAVAFYGGDIRYAMRGSANLDVLTHEATHARFDRFLETLNAWTSARGYALPYEVDGPRRPGTPEGAFMNLLDELNAWRAGESLAGGKDDAAILKILREQYGRQAGWSNAELFARLWTPEKVRGRSVPRLILDEVNALNKIDEAGLAELGRRSWAENDVVGAQNFMRLIFARYPAHRPRSFKDLPLGMTATLQALLQSPDDGVAGEARYLLRGDRFTPSSPKSAWAADPALSPEEQARHLTEAIGDALRMDTSESADRSRRASLTIALYLSSHEFPSIYSEKELGRWDAADQVLNRTPQPDRLFFTMDGLLAQGLFDGESPSHRLALLNIIRTRTFPEELPLTHKKLLDALVSGGNDPSTQNNRRLAEKILVTGGEGEAKHLAWPESAAEAIRRAPAGSIPARTLEMCAEYYRLTLAHSLPGPLWGEKAKGRLDAAMRREARLGLDQFSPNDRQRYDKALEHLSLLLENPELKVRVAARFAIAEYPGYALGLEGFLSRALRGEPGVRRTEAVALMSMTRKGFLPEADAALEDGFSPTAEEAVLLKSR